MEKGLGLLMGKFMNLLIELNKVYFVLLFLYFILPTLFGKAGEHGVVDILFNIVSVVNICFMFLICYRKQIAFKYSRIFYITSSLQVFFGVFITLPFYFSGHSKLLFLTIFIYSPLLINCYYLYICKKNFR